ncbi:unnamed protein product [Rotaria socialis]|uniref:Glycosyl transferase family 25 domain-containing protein n=1 Tax=Rotaria socialis TaxID=392032 RepID=A0A818AL20_9BILA|nr:unnamed protein product [Rotaria socialis]CAF4598065.1 unnamed protein product [Rotaria socialis]
MWRFKLKSTYTCMICGIIVITSIFSNFYCYKTASLVIRINHDGRLPVAYIITVPGYDQRVTSVIDAFKQYAQIDLRRFNGIRFSYESHVKNGSLTVGEQSLRATMTKFFNMIIRKNYEKVFVFEDDAIPHRNFTVLFKQLPSRCLEADVLLLGATIWHSKHTDWPSEACFDADRATFGAFALLLRRKSYRPILHWLKFGKPKPYDHVYRYLQQQKLIVRVAFPPFLVIPDVSHLSLINNNRSGIQFDTEKRAEQHLWHLKDYPMTRIPIHSMKTNRRKE